VVQVPALKLRDQVVQVVLREMMVVVQVLQPKLLLVVEVVGLVQLAQQQLIVQMRMVELVELVQHYL